MQVSTQGDDDQTKDSTTWFFSAPINYYIYLRHRLITSGTNYCTVVQWRPTVHGGRAYIGVWVGGTNSALTRTPWKTKRLRWEPARAADGLLGKCGVSSWGTEGP